MLKICENKLKLKNLVMSKTKFRERKEILLSPETKALFVQLLIEEGWGAAVVDQMNFSDDPRYIEEPEYRVNEFISRKLQQCKNEGV